MSSEMKAPFYSVRRYRYTVIEKKTILMPIEYFCSCCLLLNKCMSHLFEYAQYSICSNSIDRLVTRNVSVTLHRLHAFPLIIETDESGLVQ